MCVSMCVCDKYSDSYDTPHHHGFLYYREKNTSQLWIIYRSSVYKYTHIYLHINYIWWCHPRTERMIFLVVFSRRKERWLLLTKETKWSSHTKHVCVPDSLPLTVAPLSCIFLMCWPSERLPTNCLRLEVGGERGWISAGTVSVDEDVMFAVDLQILYVQWRWLIWWHCQEDGKSHLLTHLHYFVGGCVCACTVYVCECLFQQHNRWNQIQFQPGRSAG